MAKRPKQTPTNTKHTNNHKTPHIAREKARDQEGNKQEQMTGESQAQLEVVMMIRGSHVGRMRGVSSERAQTAWHQRGAPGQQVLGPARRARRGRGGARSASSSAAPVADQGLEICVRCKLPKIFNYLKCRMK